jgi:hypothetical protein
MSTTSAANGVVSSAMLKGSTRVEFGVIDWAKRAESCGGSFWGTTVTTKKRVSVALVV